MDAESKDYVLTKDKVRAIIDEYEKMLSPCAHCGREHPHINYTFRPGYMSPVFAHAGSTKIVSKEHPHEVYVKCRWRIPDHPSAALGCNIRTMEWFALDDIDDFREALRLIVVTWNRRPGDPEDPSTRW